MTVRILDATTRAAVIAATTQQGQCEAIRDAFAGNVTLRIEGAGGQHLRTITLAPFTINSAAPRGLVCGAVLADTAVAPTTPGAAGIAPVRWEFRNGSTPIFDTDAITQGAIKTLCQPTFGSVVFTANPALPVNDPLPLTEVVASPQFWTQFSRPQVVRSGDFVYLGHTNMNGDTVISQYNMATGTTTSFTLAGGTGPNGHDSCVISIRPDGRIIAVWSRQNADCWRRISTSPHDVTAWGSAVELSGVNPVSYASIWYLSTPNRHYVHARDGNGGGPGDRFCVAWASTNNGDSFGTGEAWITQTGERPYVISVGNGTNRIDFFCTNKHQTDSGPDAFFNLYHCYAIFAENGSKQFFKTDGTLIGSSVTQLSTQATLIYAGATAGPAWPWDIALGDDGHPRVLYVRQASDDDHRHHFGRWNGSEWVLTEIGASGARLYSTEIWSDGALTFDGLGVDCIVRSVQVGSAWELQDWRTTDNGASWTKYADITTGSSSGVKAVTPLKVTNANARVSRAVKIGTISHWDNFALALNLMGKE